MDGPNYQHDPGPGEPAFPPPPTPAPTRSGGRVALRVGVVAVFTLLACAAVYSATRPDVASEALEQIEATAETNAATTALVDDRKADRDDDANDDAEGASALDEPHVGNCRIQLATLSVALQAHEAMKGEFASDEDDLVTAGLLRDDMSLYDVDDGKIVLADGSPCDPPRARRPTTPVAPTTTTTTVVDTAASACVALADGLDAAAGGTADEGAGRFLDDVEAVRADLDAAMVNAPAAQRGAIEEITWYVDDFVATAREALALGAAPGSPDVAAATDALVFAMGGLALETTTVRTAFVELGFACFDEFGGDITIDEAFQLMARTADVVGAIEVLEWLGHPEVIEAFMTAHEVAELKESLEEAIGTPESTYLAEYRSSALHPSAEGPGDSEACDTLMGACDDGDLLACNDLYRISIPGSRYEAVGDSCGGRVTLQHEAAGGSCELLG